MRKLDPHQITAKRHIRNLNGVAGLGMAPGTGKTIVAIRVAETPALVICRRDDFLTWSQELQMEGVPKRKIHFIDKSTVKKPLPPFLPGRWYIVSYDRIKGFVRKEKRDEETGEITRKGIRRMDVPEWIKSHSFAQLIWDEFHYCKSWKTTRTKDNFKATRHIPRRLGLTGTVIGNSIRDVFATSKLLDNGKLFGDNEWWFLRKYFVRDGHGWYPRKGAKDTIKERMKKLWYYVHEDDVLKLPPCRPVVKGVPMTGMQRRHYEQILTEWETTLADGTTIELDYVIVQLQKLKQVASGFMYDEEGNARWFRNNKMPKLFDLIADDFKDHKKIVVWCSYTAEIERIAEEAERRGIRHVQFRGKMSRKAQEAARLQFRDDPKTRLFIAQVDKGVGMNELIVSDVATWYSNSLKVISKQQSRRRNRRRGSQIHKRIYHIDLCTEGTLDLKLARSIRAAMNLAHDILSACRAGENPRRFLTT